MVHVELNYHRRSHHPPPQTPTLHRIPNPNFRSSFKTQQPRTRTCSILL
jgi:hypothetical protein